MSSKTILPSLLAAVSSASIFACTSTVTGTEQTPDASIAEPDAQVSLAVACGALQADLSSVTPTIQLVVDRSWSMGTAFGDTTRWNAVRAALLDAETGIVARYEEVVRFGVTFFTSTADADICPMIDGTSPALSSHQAIASVYDQLGPLGHTPTGESLHDALATIQAVQADGPRVMVLATDGLPDTCAIPHPNNTPEAYRAALGAAEDAFAAGIATIILSVGPEVAEEHLQDIANAGAGVDGEVAPDAPYYVALDSAGLAAAMDQIINGVRSCAFPIETFTELGSGEEGLMLVDGVVVLDDMVLVPEVDWRIRGNDTIEILGRACERLEEGTHHIEGQFFCQGRLM